MLEKVARAICKAGDADWNCIYNREQVRFKYLEMAKAAIKELSNPTDKMIEPFSDTADDEYIKRCWLKAFEEALKE